jgi:hypothetical protein
MDNTTDLVLRDIRSLDAIPWWPPALGWWFIVGFLLIVVLFLWYKRRQYYYWRIEARHQLHALQKRLLKENTKQIVADFSELLRRIAIARYGRDTCAGLIGEDWLLWLQDHDPSGFAWIDKGQLLISTPYAPPKATLDVSSLKTLLEATKVWVEAEVTKKDQRVGRKFHFFQRARKTNG